MLHPLVQERDLTQLLPPPALLEDSLLSPATRLKPPLKWAGGKRWQLPYLRPLWQPHAHRRLVEPFCGGLAVTLGLLPERALISDISAHLINFYRWLKRGLVIDLPMRNARPLYDRYRNRFNGLLAGGSEGSMEAAALFYDLNRTGYNGLCRFNRQGGFNVPFGRYAQITYVRDFSPYRERLRHWTFTNLDFELGSRDCREASHPSVFPRYCSSTQVCSFDSPHHAVDSAPNPSYHTGDGAAFGRDAVGQSRLARRSKNPEQEG